MHHALLLLHVLGACIWTGGHLVLALAVLPRVMRERSVQRLRDFESGFERIGMPALVVQVVTGLWMASMLVSPSQWFEMQTPASRLIVLKLALLFATAALALDARLRIIPRLSEATLPAMARRIAAVTILSVLFVATGVGFRYGSLL